MRSGIMHKVCLFFALSALPVLFATDSMAAIITHGTSKSQVLKVCGKNIQEGNGQTGCSKCGPNSCSDYNCSNGTHGVPKGCQVVTISSRQHQGRKPVRGLQNK